MMRRMMAGVFLGGLLVILAQATARAQKDGKEVVVTDKDAKAKLAKGDTLVVKLEANPSTGFKWLVGKIKDEQLKKTKDEFLKPEKKLVGAKTTQVLTFSTLKAGTSELELHYKRPFEKGKEPAKTYKLTVTIE